jgi:hypothetical protein
MTSSHSATELEPCDCAVCRRDLDVDAELAYESPYTGDEPLGTCVIHGDYWTDDCLRCRRER